MLYEEACLPLEEVLKKYGIRVRFEGQGQQNQSGPKKFLSPPTVRKSIHPEADGNDEEIGYQPTPPSSPDSRVDGITESPKKNGSVVEKMSVLKRKRNGKMKNCLDIDDETVKCDVGTIDQNDENDLIEDGLPNVKRVKETNHVSEEALCQLPDSASEIDPDRSEDVKENGYAPLSTIDLLPKVDDDDEDDTTVDPKLNELHSAEDGETKQQNANLKSSAAQNPAKFVKKSIEQMLLERKKEADSRFIFFLFFCEKNFNQFSC